MKKIFALFLVMSMLCTLLVPFTALADGNVSIVIDGAAQNYAISAFTKDGRTLAPMDEFFKALGAEYTYNAETKKINAALDVYTVQLTVDSKNADATMYPYTLDVAPQTEGDTVMVPVRFVATQLGYKVGWDDATQTVSLEKYNLTSAPLTSEGQKNMIARAKLMSDVKFVPKAPIPTKSLRLTDTYFEEGQAYTGFPYSSCETNNKFIAENVSFETFLSAVANPDSVLYTKNLKAYRNGAGYYGIVCNGLVRYCINLQHQRHNTKYWMDIPGMKEVYPLGKQDIEGLQPADILHVATAENARSVNHNAIITDILRDETGKVVMIEVTEATFPTCRTRRFNVEDYLKEFDIYRVCRYEYMESVPPIDEADYKAVYDPDPEMLNPMIAVDNGNKSNYLLGDETVISVFAEGANTVQVYKDGQLLEEVAVNGYTQIRRSFEVGYYEAKLANTEHMTEFAVVEPMVSHSLNNNMITVRAEAPVGSKVSHMEFRKAISGGIASLDKMIDLTEEEKASGVFTREIPETAVNYRVTYENKYGHWTHQVIDVWNPDIYVSYKLSDGHSYKANTIVYKEGTEKPQIVSVKLVDESKKYEIIHEDNSEVIRVYEEEGYRDWYVPYQIGEIKTMEAFAENPFTEHKIVGLEENATHSKNVWPEGICDNDYTTMWGCTVIGDSLVMDLGEVKDITHFGVAQWDAANRTFFYQIQVSEDGVNYTTVKEVTSYDIDGKTGVCQLFAIEPTKARYVKIYNHGGNTKTKAQNFYEFKVLQMN